MRVLTAALVVLCLSPPAYAQESRIASDWRRERERIAENCSAFTLGKVASCAVTLATDYPVHVAAGNLAPQNGLAFGVAFVERFTPNTLWRMNWSADIVGSLSGSWRTGAYATFVRTAVSKPKPTTGGVAVAPSAASIREYPVFALYAQRISLNTISFYGTGQSSLESNRTVYGETESIFGGNVILPIGAKPVRALRMSLVGGVNGRFVNLRANHDESVPSIETVFDDASAPGLSDQPAFLELQEGVRLRPSLLDGRLRFNYLFEMRQFVARGDAHSSFNRWTLDLRHEFPIYQTVSSAGPRDTNGPNECFTGASDNTCPPLTFSRNRSGAIGFRLLTSSSSPFGDGRVPFYLQPTIGGADLNGQRLLAGFDDYRFRGPHLFVLQETIEHSLWGPIGAYFAAEQGMVGNRRQDLAPSNFTHSFSAGLNIRAGGFPMIVFAFAWGPEGNHIIGTMDASLLGGSSRPPLF